MPAKEHYQAMVKEMEIIDLETLILASRELSIIKRGYRDLPIGAPSWVFDIKETFMSEIAHRSRNILKLQLKRAKIARADARSAEERRKDLDQEIADLQKKLSNL